MTSKYSLSDSCSSLCDSSSALGSTTNHELARQGGSPITDHPRSALSLLISEYSKLFCTPLQAKSLPCHSYKYMGGRGSEIPYLVEIADSAPGGVGGYPTRVHISLNLKHLAISTQCSLNPYAPSHTRYARAKSLPAITYENTGGGGSDSRVHISLNPQHLAFSPLQHFNRSTLLLLHSWKLPPTLALQQE
jgi:hypothetical protein